MAVATAVGFARWGYFIPYRYAGAMPGTGARAPYDAIAELFRRHEGEFETVLADINRFADALRAIGDQPPPAPRWNQDWFPRLDAAAAYALLRARAPKRLVEVGSGHSTRFLARALADGGISCHITAIDPAPRATLARLDSVELLRAPVHQAGLAPFEALEAGDILFIDSSHILMPGTDVDFLLNRVLPILPASVRIHIHDIFLPDDYPADWAWRGYNEQLGCAALLASGGYAPVFASHYVASRMGDALRASVVDTLPKTAAIEGCSLWLNKL